MEIIEKDYYKILSIKDSDGSISNSQILVIGVTGIGKSTITESLVEEFHKFGYTIIYLTEKPYKSLESAFCMFKPKAHYHVNALRIIGKEQKEQSAIIYHPASLNIPLHRDLPPMKIFTIPIKSNSEEEFTMLYETTSKSDEVKASMNAIKNLQENEGLFSFFFYLERLIKPEKEFLGTKIYIKREDQEGFFTKTPFAGSQKTISDIKSDLSPFLQEFCLSPERFELNLDFKEILKNNKDYHILTTAFIRNKKLRYYMRIWFLNQIIKTASSWENKDGKLNPVLIVVPEGKIFLPERTDEKYIKIASEILMNLLSTMRNIGKGFSSITDSQNMYEISTSYRESMNYELYSKLSNDDIERLSKVQALGSEVKRMLANMERGHIIIRGDEDYEDFSVLLPSHAHNEEGEEFITRYEHYHPENLINYKNIVKKIVELKNNESKIIKDKFEIRDKIEKEKMIEIMKRRAKETKDKEKVKEMEIELKQSKEKLKEETYVKALRLYEQSGKWTAVARELGTSDKTARDYAERGKKILESQNASENSNQEISSQSIDEESEF